MCGDKFIASLLKANASNIASEDKTLRSEKAKIRY